MRVPLNWLREHCDPPLDTAGIEERLTMTGTKVETVFHHGVPSVEHFVAGRVLSVEPHPDADRLRVCSVEVGGEAPAGIVCGAPNVAAGQTVAVALPGATMPDGMKIKAAKLRGVPSNGMILAEDELQVGAGHEGIMVLDGLVSGGGQAPGAELAPGTPLADVLAISTDVLELEVTPNRPDCLGVYGVARELHAATGAPLGPEPWADDPGNDGPLDGAEVAVECPDLCRRFTARVFEGVTIAPSPPWLKARLMAAGQRPINNVVDITNYAMLETGQPMHAFDLDRVAGRRLVVRRARDGEQVRTLDGQTRALDGEMVVIDDADGPTSIAGVMGGERSEVQPDTTRVLMEVANWSGPNIHRTSWALGLRSEASARFEKDLAPEQCTHAQAVATRLMVEVCGATVLPGTIDVHGELPPASAGAGAASSGTASSGTASSGTASSGTASSGTASSGTAPSGTASSGTASGGTASGGATPTIRLREWRVESLLGMPVARERQAEILRALDFGVADAPDGLDVIVPAVRRNDVTREADLIEEVARIHGLEALPATLPARRGAYGRLSDAQRARRRAVDALVGRGCYEVCGWTFTSAAPLERLRLPADDPRRAAPELDNPLSEEQSLLRTTLLCSLLDVAAHNVARGMRDLRLFELGTVFRLADGTQTEEVRARGTDVDGVQAPGTDVDGVQAHGTDVDGVQAHGTDVGGVQAYGTSGQTNVIERQALCVLLSGRIQPPTWGAPEPPRAELFAVKALLEALGQALRVPVECLLGQQPFLHPGRAADVLCGGQRIGWLGELHPLVAREWGLEGVAAMEIELEGLLAARAQGESGFSDVISFPALHQDLAVVLPREVSAARALETVRGAGGALLDDVRVFDVYSGSQVGEGRRSLALSLSFRATDRTLTDEDVAPLREKVVAALAGLGGELRG